MSFDEVWDADPPEDAKGDSLLEYMKDVRFPFLASVKNYVDNYSRQVETPSSTVTTTISINSEKIIKTSSERSHMLAHL
jgi:hypothetical protein